MIKLKAIMFLTFLVFCLPSYGELLKFDCTSMRSCVSDATPSCVMKAT